MKKRIFSILMYLANLVVLWIPWLTVGDKKLNVFQFGIEYLDIGMNGIIQEAGVTYYQASQLRIGVTIELILFLALLIEVLAYLGMTILGKKTKINILCVMTITVALYMHMAGESLDEFSLEITDIAIPFILLTISGLEFTIRIFMEGWKEAVAETNRQKAEEKALKEEKDVNTEKEIMDMIYDRCKDITCIFIAHRMNTIRRCDEIFVFEEGRVKASGNPEEIIHLYGKN